MLVVAVVVRVEVRDVEPRPVARPASPSWTRAAGPATSAPPDAGHGGGLPLIHRRSLRVLALSALLRALPEHLAHLDVHGRAVPALLGHRRCEGAGPRPPAPARTDVPATAAAAAVAAPPQGRVVLPAPVAVVVTVVGRVPPLPCAPVAGRHAFCVARGRELPLLVVLHPAPRGGPTDVVDVLRRAVQGAPARPERVVKGPVDTVAARGRAHVQAVPVDVVVLQVERCEPRAGPGRRRRVRRVVTPQRTVAVVVLLGVLVVRLRRRPAGSPSPRNGVPVQLWGRVVLPVPLQPAAAVLTPRFL